MSLSVKESELHVIKLDHFRPGAKIRVLEEDIPLFYTADIAMLVTGTDKDHAAEYIRRASAKHADIKETIVTRLIHFRQNYTAAAFVPFSAIPALIEGIGGKAAKAFRAKHGKALADFFLMCML